jgi:phosphoglycerate dehydrogenase-like enzyme
LQYCGWDISGSTVGIVGLGRIGVKFAKMLSGFGVDIVYSGPRERREEALSVGAR